MAGQVARDASDPADTGRIPKVSECCRHVMKKSSSPEKSRPTLFGLVIKESRLPWAEIKLRDFRPTLREVVFTENEMVLYT